MAVNNKHPLYTAMIDRWNLCRDSYLGEDQVKGQGTKYLPATSGQKEDGITLTTDTGYKDYEAYKTRAVYHDYFKEAVETYIGIMWSEKPVIELPSKLEGMMGSATTKGESLEQLLRRINEQQLVTGRVGLLLDLPPVPQSVGFLPYIAMYNAESIINWDDGRKGQLNKDSLNLVVLNESDYERGNDFVWDTKERYRVLTIGDTLENEAQGVYKVGVFEGDNTTFSESAMMEPYIKGAKLDRIPFVFINSKDIVTTPDVPPLTGVAKLSMAIYRGEADYRQSLFLQGQDTLVLIGGQGGSEDSLRVGTGGVIDMPTNGDAKFIGVDSSGLSEQRLALENDKAQIANKSGQLIDTRSRQKESGEALTKRIAAQTATLKSIAQSGAEGLEKILKFAAEWVGANPEEVKVEPNLDFAEETLEPKQVLDMMTAKGLGAPLSKRSIHSMMRDKGMTEMEYEEELQEIDSEAPDDLEGTDAGGSIDDEA
jgi:hypothetical protein